MDAQPSGLGDGPDQADDVTDPLGGINTLWPLFGISNQMLAAIALILCTVVLFKMKRQRYAWVTMVPTAWLLICTLTAGWQKLFHPNPAIGFLSHAGKFSDALAAGTARALTEEGKNSWYFVTADYAFGHSL